MSVGDESTRTLIPVHVGLRQPSFAPPVLGGSSSRFAEPSRDNSLLDRDFDWEAHRVTPRWIGMESSDCPAALEPSIYHQNGGDELKRFLAGAASRGETAVLIATMGNANDDRPRGLHSQGHTSVMLPSVNEYVLGTRTPARSAISLAPGVTGPDRDLGLRLQSRPSDAPWWSMSLQGTQTATAFGPGESNRPTGTLEPILLDAVGQPVAAVWVSESDDQRWYLVPDQADWDSILDWLTTQALPAFAPAILRQLRSPLLRDPELLTSGESEAQDALDALDNEYERRRAALQEQLDQARARADPIRDGLLYGTAKALERAVAGVLTDAGITLVDLDTALGDTSSADLLAELDARRRLI
jgi:hypothetical protein